MGGGGVYGIHGLRGIYSLTICILYIESVSQALWIHCKLVEFYRLCKCHLGNCAYC